MNYLTGTFTCICIDTFLQGMSFKQVNGEVQNMLQDLQLADKRGTAPRHLSGGMKRKLRSENAFASVSGMMVIAECRHYTCIHDCGPVLAMGIIIQV